MMKYEDAESERTAELRLSLQALHGRNQLLESQALSLELMQQQGHSLSMIEQQLLLQQQQQLMHAQALMQSVHHTQDTLALSSPPGLAMAGAEVAGFGGDSAFLDSSAFARQQQRASAADHWREKKRRQAQLQDGAMGRQSGSDPESEAAPARVGPTSAAAASASANANTNAAGKGAQGTNGGAAVEGRKKGQSADKRKEESRRKRLLRNRVSAQQARERKRSYMQDLEKQCSDLESKNTNLEDQINALSQENDGLRQMMKRTVQARRGGAETEEPSASDGEDAE